MSNTARKVREKFATQINSEILVAVRMLAERKKAGRFRRSWTKRLPTY